MKTPQTGGEGLVIVPGISLSWLYGGHALIERALVSVNNHSHCDECSLHAVQSITQLSRSARNKKDFSPLCCATLVLPAGGAHCVLRMKMRQSLVVGLKGSPAGC